MRNAMKNAIHMSTRAILPVAAVALLAGFVSCQSSRADRNWVQTNVVEKSLFQGEWYYIRTVVDHDYESYWMGYYGTFTGDQTGSTELWATERIRWLIDEKYLYAYRADPIVTGADDDESDPEYRGGAVAAFPIEEHLDVIRQYNPVTGERLNVLAEDSSERPWYDREFMRVDWSQNTVTGFYWNSLDAFESEGMVTREATAFACLEGTDQGYTSGTDEITFPVCREEWLPQVRYTSAAFDETYGTNYTAELHSDACASPITGEIAPDCTGEGFPYMYSFVNQEIWSPTYDAFGYLGSVPFSSVRVTVRNTFVRSPERSSYEPLMVPDTQWDRFGTIRLSRSTYTGGEGEDPVQGIEPVRGLTDALEYWGARHNTWVDYRDRDGAVIPAANREKRHVVYYLNAGFPQWLMPVAFRIVSDWNVSMMHAYYLSKGMTPPADPEGYNCALDMGAAGSVAGVPEAYSAYDGILSDPPAFVASNPGTPDDCALVLRVNSADLPEGTYEDVVGTRNIVRTDDGSIDPDQSNVEPFGEMMGDFRFMFMHVIDTPGAAFSGVSLPLMDIRTGQLVSSNCNVTLDSIQWTQTSIIRWLGLEASLCEDDDLVSAELCAYLQSLDLPDLEDIMAGEDVREYFANLGNAELPISPITPEALSGPESAWNPSGLSSELHYAIQARMASAAEKSAALAGPEGQMLTFGHRVKDLEGTKFESMLYDNPETLALLASRPDYGLADMSMVDRTSDDVLDEVSLFRSSIVDQSAMEERRMQKLAAHHFDLSSPFMEYGYLNQAQKFMDDGFTVRQIGMWVGQNVFYNVMLHELGHSLGMEHNFAGSIDYKNYADCYFDVQDDHPWPAPDEFTTSESLEWGRMTFEETVNWSREVQDVQAERSLAGIDKCAYTSIMDYPLDFLYDQNPADGLGKYDKAYMDFTYGGKVEAMVGDPRWTHPVTGSKRWELIDPRGHEKIYWAFYLGGEECETDSDCPYSAGSALLVPGQQVTQVCRVHPRAPIGGEDLLPRVCSSFDDDFYSKVVNDWAGGDAPYFPVTYMYCTDNRTTDISWCNRWDRGASFREVVRNWANYYDKVYPFSWFRNYRRLYGGASYWNMMTPMVKIYQHWLYRYFYEPGYSELEGPLYSDDQYLASLDALNFFARILGTPDVGSYDLDPVTNNYYKVADETGTGADLDVAPGMGKYMWSSWQDGPMGITQLERMGLHWDKIYALLAMAVRDWNLMYSYDERFTINFYSLFEWEIMRIFGGVILDDPTWFTPRWHTDAATSEQFLYYPQIWGGICSMYNMECPEDYYYDDLAGEPAFENSSNEMIRNYAAIFSLAEFPIFYDTRYEQQLFLCERGSGYCFDICEAAGDAFYCDNPGAIVPADSYALYTSDTLHKTIQAVAFEDAYPEYNSPPQVDVSLELLNRANALQTAFHDLEAHQLAGTCPAGWTVPCDDELAAAIVHASYELSQHESFLYNLMDLQKAYGITSWL